MNILNKKLNEAIAEAKETPEEWIWVEGFKGTNKIMVCRDYQFEMHKQFDIPADEKIEDCKNGFHLCLNLKDVFSYYKVGNGNRFFRVRALVRKKDVDEYFKVNNPYMLVPTSSSIYPWSPVGNRRDKLAARSIQFLYEMTADEILSSHKDIKEGELTSWSDELKKVAIESGIHTARKILDARELVELGYSLPFAEFIVDECGGYEIAKAVGSQTDLSMDMKVLFIMKGLTNRDGLRQMTSADMMSTVNSAIANLASVSSRRR